MDFVKLSYFIKAATYSNFSMAAQECHIAQTAMSRHIADIEKELGVELFKRMPKKVVLTPAGELFFKEIKELMKKYNDIVIATRNAAAGHEGSLTIAFGFYERSLLVEYVTPFIEKYPKISISIQQHPYGKLMQELKRGNCDIAFAPPNWAATLENTRTVALRTNRNCIVMSKNNPLTKKEEVFPEDVDNCVFIQPGYESPLLEFERLCRGCGITPQKLVYVDTLDEMFSVVEMNVGIALAPSYIVGDYNNVEFRPFNYSELKDKRHVAMCLDPVLSYV